MQGLYSLRTSIDINCVLDKDLASLALGLSTFVYQYLGHIFCFINIKTFFILQFGKCSDIMLLQHSVCGILRTKDIAYKNINTTLL